jgi:CelD/BcsL family acetyltransferase involved in cellulose biosynthesis
VAHRCALALWERRAYGDVMRLRYLPTGAAALGVLAPALRGRRVDVRIDESARNPYISLAGDWATYYGGRSRRLKKATNLAANRLARAGSVTVDWLAPGEGAPEEVEQRLATVTALSARSWKQRTGNSLDHPGPQAFLRRLAHGAHRRGWLSLFTLAIDGKPGAMELQLVDGRDAYALRADFDAALDELSPGSHLSRTLLERLFGRGLARYYMGPGDNAYKYRWADGSEPVHTMTAYGRTPRGRTLGAWERAVKPLLRRLRDRLRPPQPAAGDDGPAAGDAAAAPGSRGPAGGKQGSDEA